MTHGEAARLTVPVFLGDLGSVGEFPVQLERWHVARWDKQPLKTMTYPLVMKIAIEIVDLPIKNDDFPVRYGTVYQVAFDND